MKLIGVKINNYKSFGEEENYLYVNNLNTVIGKNESGKSNLLDALADIGYIGISDNKLFEKNNRKSEKDVKIELFFETKENENFLYDNYKGKVSVILEDKDIYKINEEFGEYIVKLKEYKEILEEILILKDEVPISKPENRKKMLIIIEGFEKVKEEIFVKPEFYDSFVNTLKATKDEKILKLLELFETMIGRLDNIYLNFPNFVKIENVDLKNRYTISELKEELEEYNDRSILYQLFNICEIDSKKLISVMEKKESTKIRECEEDIQRLIEENFIEKFKQFYLQETLKIAIDVKSDSLDIMIKSTSGAYLDYTERSNGFKWYVSIFIQLLYKNKSSGTMTSHILLLDEPGVYLHANAQRELRNLLSDLSKNEEQIIYTTHSPFMIDKEDLLSIRALIKDDDGYSHIHNKITTIPTNEKSRYDTITPILYALGCDAAYDMGPSDSECNIITEGITDYYCLIGYSESTDNKMKYKIIPSNGANDVTSIAAILFGWGCNFVILLDQDDKGRSIYQSLEDTNSPFIDKVIFANSSKTCDKSINFEIENIFSDEDREKFGFKKSDYKEKKYNYVTDMLTKIKCKEEKYDSTTIDNFSSLLKEIEKMK